MAIFRRLPVLDWLQVEVTTYCNASCRYCPHTVYRARWVSRHLPMETFAKLLPAVKRSRLVFLQGWGEPFLNPDFFAMATLAGKEGCAVGTTTNGMLLDEEKAARLVDTGVDVVAFSLAGTGAMNDFWRRGTHLDQVLKAIKNLAAEKARRRTAKPAIHVAYMLLRSGLYELKTLPDLLAGTGVREVVISVLDFIPAPDLVKEVVTLEDDAATRMLLQEVVEAGRERGLAIHYRVPRPAGGTSCAENATRAAFIAADGSLSPCVFTNLPLSEIPAGNDGSGTAYHKVTFGNVSQEPFGAIWNRRAYREFRASLAAGVPPAVCRSCPRLYLETV
ncbi:MAG: radical SAM protein [Bacillota bacterium]